MDLGSSHLPPVQNTGCFQVFCNIVSDVMVSFCDCITNVFKCIFCMQKNGEERSPTPLTGRVTPLNQESDGTVHSRMVTIESGSEGRTGTPTGEEVSVVDQGSDNDLYDTSVDNKETGIVPVSTVKKTATTTPYRMRRVDLFRMLGASRGLSILGSSMSLQQRLESSFLLRSFRDISLSRKDRSVAALTDSDMAPVVDSVGLAAAVESSGGDELVLRDDTSPVLSGRKMVLSEGQIDRLAQLVVSSFARRSPIVWPEGLKVTADQRAIHTFIEALQRHVNQERVDEETSLRLEDSSGSVEEGGALSLTTTQTARLARPFVANTTAAGLPVWSEGRTVTIDRNMIEAFMRAALQRRGNKGTTTQVQSSVSGAASVTARAAHALPLLEDVPRLAVTTPSSVLSVKPTARVVSHPVRVSPRMLRSPVAQVATEEEAFADFGLAGEGGSVLDLLFGLTSSEREPRIRSLGALSAGDVTVILLANNALPDTAKLAEVERVRISDPEAIQTYIDVQAGLLKASSRIFSLLMTPSSVLNAAGTFLVSNFMPSVGEGERTTKMLLVSQAVLQVIGKEAKAKGLGDHIKECIKRKTQNPDERLIREGLEGLNIRGSRLDALTDIIMLAVELQKAYRNAQGVTKTDRNTEAMTCTDNSVKTKAKELLEALIAARND